MKNVNITNSQKQICTFDLKAIVAMALTSMNLEWKFTGDDDVIMFSNWISFNSRCTGTLIFSDSYVRIIIETPSCNGLELDFERLDDLEEFCENFIECDGFSLIKDENEVKVTRKIPIEKFGTSIFGVQVSIYDTLYKYMCVLSEEYEVQIREDSEMIDDLIQDTCIYGEDDS